MDQRSDYYSVLGVSKDATAYEIKSAYRKLAVIWHPDKNPDKAREADMKFKKILEAYALLSDEKQRSIYDMHGSIAMQSSKLSSHYDSGEVFQRFFSDCNNAFIGLNTNDVPDFRSRRCNQNSVKKERNVSSNDSLEKDSTKVTLLCTLEELFWGADKIVRIRRQVRQITQDAFLEETTLTVSVEAGAKDGSLVYFPNEGDGGSTLVFVLKQKKHKVFERDTDGDNLIYTAEITLLQALTGSMITVPKFTGGTITFACPEIVSPKYERIIKGEGMPINLGHGDVLFNARGDLIIRFQVMFPLSLNYNVKKQLRMLLRSEVKTT